MPITPTPPTILEFLERVFPDGTKIPLPAKRRKKPNVRQVPLFPTDVFGASAFLLYRSGAVSRLLIGVPDGGSAPISLRAGFQSMNGAVAAGGIDLNNAAIKTQFQKAGKQWARGLPVPKIVRELWKKLVDSGDEPVHHLPGLTDPFPPWWTTALALTIISDEACEGLGYATALDFRTNWLSAFVLYNNWKKNSAIYTAMAKKGTAIASGDLPSLCVLADPDVLCVQPKVRTPSVGCTLRSYTHNVALLPPRGIVSTGWQAPPEALKPDDSPALNLLIIPYPYHVQATSFEGIRVSSGAKQPMNWGWFQLRQEWLTDKIVEFTEALIKEAQKDVGVIHGVLFPESAMTWLVFEQIKDMLLDKFPQLEFLISGSSSNCINEQGNFVLSAVFLDLSRSSSGTGRPPRGALVSSRWKHHRWRLDEPQISNYALGSTLDPRVLWWEATSLGPREVTFTVFRQSSAFTTLICEDLARSDPCHAVLRDVGPNLVFVMLMDGPQLKSRWSARYSTTLADDPGSSVLTYTSMALINRSNRTGAYPPSHVIGLWKDDTGKTVEINCPADAHGVVLSLSDASVCEATLDGRCVEAARAWRFHSHHSVTIKDGTKRDVIEAVTKTS